jgi:hypothetical protein
MPRPLGLDRLEPSHDGTLVLLSLHPKTWAAREETAPGRVPLPGTAVRWDEALFEVVRIEPRQAGGFRHVLAPWDERQIIRSLVDYGADDDAASLPEAVGAPANDAHLRFSPARSLPSGSAGPLASRWAALPSEIRGLVLGFVPAVFLGWLFPFRLMGEGMSFLVHELGHTLTAWFFGCSAFPAVVMTIAFEQKPAAAALIWAGIVYAACRYRRAPRWNVAFTAAAALYPFIAFTKAHVTAFDVGGHVAEAAVAAWAILHLTREERPDWERPVWSFFAFYLVARNVKMFGGVALSASARSEYIHNAITGENDLAKVAKTTGIGLGTLGALTALVFLAAALAALWLTFRDDKTRIATVPGRRM